MRIQWRSTPVLSMLTLIIVSASMLENSYAQTPEPVKSAESPPETSFSGDPNAPRRHFRVRRAKHLDSATARAIYNGQKAGMAKGYAIAEDATVRRYQTWKRYNTAPYQSSTHGNRYVNNYANTKASRYGAYDSAGTLPVGSVIAKDSFVVDKEGAAAPGPLFIMEKMAEGFNYVSGDWRYTMILPDGSRFGTTKGDNAARVEFCISCHLAREKFDHLFFLPKEWRVQ